MQRSEEEKEDNSGSREASSGCTLLIRDSRLRTDKGVPVEQFCPCVPSIHEAQGMPMFHSQAGQWIQKSLMGDLQRGTM